MKYCSNCGNPMEDNMVFCQKCGTKFVDIKPRSNALQIKLDQMKKYNLVLDSQTLTWAYLEGNGEKAGKILTKQDNLCIELIELIKDILTVASDDEKDFIEREVYTFILNMGYKMCKEAEKMFANYSGLKEQFDKWNSLVSSGQLDAEKFLMGMATADRLYKMIAGIQGLHSSRIKGALNEVAISENLEYIDLTKRLAQSYNEMWIAELKRYKDFFIYPGNEHINTVWENYLVILKGLPISVIDSLDESWRIALDLLEGTPGHSQLKSVFLENRESREELRQKEDKKYWAEHPEKYSVFKENSSKIEVIKADIKLVEEEIKSIEDNIQSLCMTKSNFEQNKAEKQTKHFQLKSKIFVTKKTKEKMSVLSNAINKINLKIAEIDKKIDLASNPLEEKKEKIESLKAKIEILEENNKKLRSS